MSKQVRIVFSEDHRFYYVSSRNIGGRRADAWLSVPTLTYEESEQFAQHAMKGACFFGDETGYGRETRPFVFWSMRSDRKPLLTDTENELYKDYAQYHEWEGVDDRSLEQVEWDVVREALAELPEHEITTGGGDDAITSMRGLRLSHLVSLCKRYMEHRRGE